MDGSSFLHSYSHSQRDREREKKKKNRDGPFLYPKECHSTQGKNNSTTENEQLALYQSHDGQSVSNDCVNTPHTERGKTCDVTFVHRCV